MRSKIELTINLINIKMTRRFDLQQFFISANSSQDKHNFNLDAFTDDYIKRTPNQQLKVCVVSHRREQFDNFYKWLDNLTQDEYDGMSLTDKIEKYFFKN